MVMKEKKLNQAQEKQDEIFRGMSADKKIEIGSVLWKMAKNIVGDKINYAKKYRSTSLVGSSRRDSRRS